MAITYRAGSLSQAYKATAGAITVNNAVGHSTGDFILIVIDIDRSVANTFTFPAGFTQIANAFNSAPDGASFAMAYKFDTGAEPSTYTITPSDAYSSQVSVSAWQGVDTTTPFTLGTLSNSTAYNNPNISMGLTGLTALAGDTLLLLGALDKVTGTDTWGFSTVAGFTSLESYVNAWNYQYIQYKSGLTAGATGTQTVVTTGGSTNGAGWIGYQLALHPAATGVTGSLIKTESGIDSIASSGTVVQGITAYNITSGANAVGGASFNTASITLTANKLGLLTVSSRMNSSVTPNTPTITGWSLVGTIEYDTVAPSQKKLSLFRRLSGTTSTSTYTIDFGGQSQTHCDWGVDEIYGINTTGTNGANAIVQYATAKDETLATSSVTVTLATFANTGNPTYGVFAHGGTVASSTAGTGFTTICPDTGYTKLATEFRTTNSTTVSISSNAFDQHGGIAIELNSVTGGGGGVTGSLIKTESGIDTISSTGKVIITGSSAKAELNDTISSTGKVLIQGSLAKTELNDSVSSSGKVIVKGSIVRTESNIDSYASTGTVLIQGYFQKSEVGVDTITPTTGKVVVQGSLTKSEVGIDTLLAISVGNITGSIAINELPDIISDIKFWDGTWIDLSGAWYDIPPVTGNVLVQGNLVKAEGSGGGNIDSISSIGKVIITGSIIRTELSDTITPTTGKLYINGNLSTTESNNDVLASIGIASIPPVTGSFIRTELSDIITPTTGKVKVQGNLIKTEGEVPGGNKDSVLSIGKVIVKGSLSFGEYNDTIAISGSTMVITGSMSKSESGIDTFTSIAKLIVKGSLTKSESGIDTFAAYNVLPVIHGTISSSESRDILSDIAIWNAPWINADGSVTWYYNTPSYGNVIVQGNLIKSEVGNDTLVSTGKVSIQGSLIRTESNDTLVSTGKAKIGGILSSTEYADVSSYIPSWDGSWLEVDGYWYDSAPNTGRVLVQGNLVRSEANDVVSAVSIWDATWVDVPDMWYYEVPVTGKVLVQGSLIKSESNDIISSFGGSISTGTINLTEYNDAIGTISTWDTTWSDVTGFWDTTPISGKVIVQGTLSKSEVGIDTLVSTGVQLSKGNLVATESRDILSDIAIWNAPWINADGSVTWYYNTPSYGNILIQGSMNRTEIGVDQFLGNASSVVYGYSNISESNDTTSYVPFWDGTWTDLLGNWYENAPNTGKVIVQGSSGTSESNDTIASIAVWDATWSDITNSWDIAPISGKVFVQGTLSKSEFNDTIVSTGSNLVKGSLVRTEANDTISTIGKILVHGSLIKSESNDIFVSTGAGVSQGNISLLESADRMSIVATWDSGTIPWTNSNGTITWYYNPPTTGKVYISGSISQSEARDTLVAIADLVVTGSASLNELRDTLLANGSNGIIGNANILEQNIDSYASTGTILVQGSLISSELSDISTISGKVITIGSASGSELNDTIISSGKVKVQGITSLFEISDLLVSSGKVITKGTVSVSESGIDTLASNGVVVITVNINAIEPTKDAFVSYGKLPISGSMNRPEIYHDTLFAEGDDVIGGYVSASEANDTLSSFGTMIVTYLVIPNKKVSISNNSVELIQLTKTLYDSSSIYVKAYEERKIIVLDKKYYQ
jgi:hypothetical protein